jgi:hypothetical protein
MKEKDLTKAERYQLMLYRAGKPKTEALPQEAYRDPADTVLFESERLEREKARAKRKAFRKSERD